MQEPTRLIQMYSARPRRQRQIEFNRCVDPMFIKELPDDDTRYPVTFVMLHNDSQIRTSFYIPENIFESITIDLDPAAFIRLPKVEIGSPEKN